MKALLSALLLISAAISGAEPSELTVMREGWERARQAAIVPVDLKYLDALKALKHRFTAAGDTEKAYAVDQEIKALSNKPLLEEPAARQPLTKDELIAARWSFVVPDSNWLDQFTFTADGKVTSAKGVWGGTWTLKNRGLRIEFKNGTVWNEFAPEPSRANGKLTLTETACSGRKPGGTLTRLAKD